MKKKIEDVRHELHVGLAPGDEAWCVIRKQVGSGERASVEDAASVRVVAVHDHVYQVTVLATGRTPVGHPYDCKRSDLYAKKDRAERSTFEGLVRSYWGGAYRGEPRT